MSTCSTRESRPSDAESAVLDAVLADRSLEPGRLIGVLQLLQDELGYVPPPAIPRIADALGVYPSQVFGVLTFYSQFRLAPVGEHVIRVCHGTACHVGGAERIMDAICEELGVEDGETTQDGRFTVEKVFCVGSCSLAPVLRVDDRTYGRLDQAHARRVLRDWPSKEPPAEESGPAPKAGASTGNGAGSEEQ